MMYTGTLTYKIVHVTKEDDHLPTITMGFTHDFLAASMMHKRKNYKK